MATLSAATLAAITAAVAAAFAAAQPSTSAPVTGTAAAPLYVRTSRLACAIHAAGACSRFFGAESAGNASHTACTSAVAGHNAKHRHSA